MKIHTKVIIDMTTDEVVHDEFFEYEGPIALAIPLAILGAVGAITGQLASAGLLGTTAAGLAGATVGGISAGTLLTVGGTALSTIGATAGAAIQQNQAAKANVEAANVEKEQIMATADERARRRIAAGNRDISTAIARLGRSGVDLAGSPLDVLMEDAANVKLGALDEIYAGRVSSSSKEYEAKLERFKSGGALISSAARSSRTILGSTQQLGTYIGGRPVATKSYGSSWYEGTD